jgi:hypothetical protein
MVAGTRARSYEEMVDALAAEGLPALQGKLSELTPQDWERPTLLQPPEPGNRRGPSCNWSPPLHMPRTTAMAAELLDEVLARRAVPGRPADLEGDDLAFIRAAAGRGEHPDPRLPVVG